MAVSTPSNSMRLWKSGALKKKKKKVGEWVVVAVDMIICGAVAKAERCESEQSFV